MDLEVQCKTHRNEGAQRYKGQLQGKLSLCKFKPHGALRNTLLFFCCVRSTLLYCALPYFAALTVVPVLEKYIKKG
jgi:hypothetical protein